MGHAWCHDIARDAAVRAAEDGRTEPLPTLGECIDGMFPKSVSASSAQEQENKGDGMATDGLRTERVSLSLKRMGELISERDAAIRERQKLEDRLSRVLKSSDSMWSQILVVGADRDALRARVAELEAAAKLAPDANADGQANHAAQAASGGGEHFADASKMVEQPRGWLTEEERNALETVRIHISNADGLDEATERECKWVSDVCYRLLARSSPPEVVLPAPPFARSNIAYRDWMMCLKAVKESLAAAGVAVKEVGRE
jgi:hypothetical protein